MASPNIKDLLVAFSPASDLFAIASGDGRIKIWDTTKGHLQTEFADLAPSDNGVLIATEGQRGHLSVDYKCMKWVQLQGKKKKPGHSMLVLGTGSGDVLALDVAAGQLRWKVSDCHPGGVSAISCSRQNSCVYTAGVDGMVCQINSITGSLLEKFKASAKAISSLSVSADGKILATAAGQLKVFDCSKNKKIKRFSGHSVAVRCMIFSEDGNHIISSGVGERYVAIWRVDGNKKQHASCVLSMEHPAVFLDSIVLDSEDNGTDGLCVLAISELGVCYLWHGSNIEELRNSKPTKISLSVESSQSKNSKGLAVYAAKFQGITKVASSQVLVAYGSMVKPSFQKILVQSGEDVNLSISQDGVLVSVGQLHLPQKGQKFQNKVSALDQANAEDAIHPLPKLYLHEKKRKHSMQNMPTVVDDTSVDPAIINKKKTHSKDGKARLQRMEEDGVARLEDKLRDVGIISKKDEKEGHPEILDRTSLDTTMSIGAHLLLYANISTKKMRAQILSMNPTDAYKLLEVSMSIWKSRPADSKHVLPWIYCILVNHNRFILAQESSSQLLDALEKMAGLKGAAIQSLLNLSGRIQLIMTQIQKAGDNTVSQSKPKEQGIGSEDEEDDDDDNVDELVYGAEEDESQSEGDDNGGSQP